jgi:hypothetical protein
MEDIAGVKGGAQFSAAGGMWCDYERLKEDAI